MPATHTLNTKIEALNLLDLHDGDFNLVKSRLGIPLNTLRRWLADEKELRLQYDDRQYRYFGNLKSALLQDALEGAHSTMQKFKADDFEHSSPSQLVYMFATLVNQAMRLEKSREDMEADSQSDSEQPEQVQIVYEDDPRPVPLPAHAKPSQPDPTASPAQRAAWKKRLAFGAGQDPGGGAPETEAPPPNSLELPDATEPPDGTEQPDGTELPDDGLNLARPGKRGTRPKKSRRKQKRKLRQSARLRRNRRRKRK